jgi:hypothetical protein
VELYSPGIPVANSRPLNLLASWTPPLDQPDQAATVQADQEA